MSYRDTLFPVEYVPTVTNCYYSVRVHFCFRTQVVDPIVHQKCITKGMIANVTLFDTAGHDFYSSFRAELYPDASAIAICFDVTNSDSFRYVESHWIKEVKLHAPHAPVILVGTKADLRGSGASVTQKEINQQMKAIGAVTYYECSAKNLSGVATVFDKLIARGAKYEMEKRGQTQPEQKKRCLIC